MRLMSIRNDIGNEETPPDSLIFKMLYTDGFCCVLKNNTLYNQV